MSMGWIANAWLGMKVAMRVNRALGVSDRVMDRLNPPPPPPIPRPHPQWIVRYRTIESACAVCRGRALIRVPEAALGSREWTQSEQECDGGCPPTVVTVLSEGRLDNTVMAQQRGRWIAIGNGEVLP